MGGSDMWRAAGIALALLVPLSAVAAKRTTDERGRPGWVYFLLVLLAFPIGIVVTAMVVFGPGSRDVPPAE